MSPRNLSIARVVIPVSLTVFFLLLARWFLGIPNGDDSLYMGDHMQMLADRGRTHIATLLSGHDWGPVYVVWFRLLSTFVHNPVSRYFVSWGIIVVLIALVPTLFARPAAWLYTLVILALPMLAEGAFVAQFASAIVLIALCWLLRQHPSFAEALCAACILSFCVKFVRPEFSYAIYLAAFATVIAVIAEKLLPSTPANAWRAGSSTVPAWVLLVTVAVLSLVMLSLSRKFPSHRSGMAFAQHYNLRATVRGLIPMSPDNWRSNYAELRFGVDTTHNAADGVATIDQFLRANPRLFLAHIFYNLLDVRSLLFTALILLACLMPWLRKDAASLRPASLVLLIISFPPIAGCLVIFPALNYISIAVPALIVFLFQTVDPERWLRPSVPWTLGLGAPLFWYLYVGIPYLAKAPISAERTNLYRIECIRRWDEPVSNPSVFSASTLFPVYFDRSRKLIFPSDLPTWSAFQAWAAKTQPDWISVDPPQHWVFGDHSLSAQYRVAPEELDSFLRNSLGYTPHPCQPDAQLTVYTHDKR